MCILIFIIIIYRMSDNMCPFMDRTDYRRIEKYHFVPFCDFRIIVDEKFINLFINLLVIIQITYHFR